MASASSYSNLVQELYVAYFGRPADYFGLQNFEAALAAANAPTDPAALATAYSTNSAVKSLVDSFGTSAESTALYGSGSTESFVNAIFENLFGRPAAVSGLTFWVSAINSGQVSKGDAALAILAGAESNTTTQGVSDWTLIQNKIAVATNFTTDLGTSSTQIVAYSGATAAQDARLLLASVTGTTDPTTFNVQTTINNIVAGNNNNTYDLTTGVDTLAGGTGNNVFNAILDNAAGVAAGGQAATLQSFDKITGGTLNNTLNITDFGKSSDMSIPSGATITGITTLNVSTLEGTDLSLAGWSALTALNIKSSAASDSVVVGDNVAVNITGTGGTIYVQGGSTVTASEDSNGSDDIYVYGGAATSAVTLTGGFENFVEDGNFTSSKANSITSVSLTGGTGTLTVDSNALTNLNLTGFSDGDVTVNAADGTRTLNLALDAVTGDSYIADNSATTVAITTATKASEINLHAHSATSLTFNDAVGLTIDGTIDASSAKAVTITGAGDFTADVSGLAAAAAINASGSSGTVKVVLAGAGGESFTGGTGADVVSIGATQTGTVTGGSNAHNEIVLNNAGTATVTDIASVTHFSIFGVAGNTQGSFDMSKVSGYNAFDVQNSGGNVSFINAATGSTISVDNGNSNVITLQTVDTTGQSDSTTLTLNAPMGATGGTDFAQVTLEDSINVGIGTVNLVSNNSNSSASNVLTSLFDNNWVTLNTSGTGFLDIVANKVDSASLTISNSVAASSSMSLNIVTLTDNLLTSLTLSGADGIHINTLSSTSATLTIVDNNTAAIAIDTLGDTSLTSATFTNSVNTTAATFTIGSGGGDITEAKLATLNLNGNVQISITGDTVTSGITVAGGTDNADVSFTSMAATATGKTNNIALGNGHDTIVLGSGTVAVPGATEVDTVTWKAITGTAPATETVDVTWQAFTAAGTETIGGMTITSDGTVGGGVYTADQVATVAAGGTVGGLTITTAPTAWTVTAGAGTTDSTFTSTTANAPGSVPTDHASTGGATDPSATETTAGTAGAGASESIGGATVSTTTNGTYTAAQVATVAGGGTVAGLTLSASPTLWTIGSASGATTTFTSTTPNHAEASPTGSSSTGLTSSPSEAQTTAGVTPISAGAAGVAGSTDTITLGTGNDSVTDFTAGTLNASLTESSTSTDSVTANNAATLHVTAGNGANTISDTAVGASIAITAGTGVNSITVGANSTGTIAVGTHTVGDTISIGATGVASNSTTAFEKITGLNNAGNDNLVFSGESGTIASIQHITSTQVAATAGGTGDATLLSAWIAAATGAAGSGVTTAAHSIAWFQFQGNTYLVETVAADTGTLAATDTVVELTGTGYTFGKTTFAAGGVVHLLG